jgi:transmembrane sensor
MIHEVLSLERLQALEPGEAAALLAVRWSGGAVAADETVLQAWLDADPANPPAWEDAQRALAAFDDADGDELLDAMRQDARKVRRAPAVAWPRFAAAAAIVLVLLGGAWLALSGGPKLPVAAPGTSVVASRTTAYASAKGQVGEFTLADGSLLTLDTESAVNVTLLPGRRDLRLLRGQAFFDVQHDAARPFTVMAAGREIVALGTRFEVRLETDQVRVVLAEGRVSVKSASAAAPVTVLHAGEQLIDRLGAAPVVSSKDVGEALSWRQGFLTFNDDTLTTAAAELNRYSRDQLIVRDPRVSRLRITGMFRAGDIPRFGRTLAQVHPVRIVRTGANQLEIVPAS